MTSPFFTVRMKKKAVGGLAGTMAGDALRPQLVMDLEFFLYYLYESFSIPVRVLLDPCKHTILSIRVDLSIVFLSI
jgi:hypothetical protein